MHHAYLFDTTNLNNKKEFAVTFAKLLLCPKKQECENCYICKRIDNNNFSELKIIEPDGQWIKKEQVLELQKEYATKPIESKYKIYIINQCDRLNKSAASSLLKFLEEPEVGIIAILLTDNIHQVIKTIMSRCQTFSFEKEDTAEKITAFFKSGEKYNLALTKEEALFKIEKIITFIKNVETDKEKTLLEINNLWFNHINSKNEFSFAFEVMILFYRDVLNYLSSKEIKNFSYMIEEIKKIASINDIITIIKKIKILIQLKDKIDMNINSNLLLDKLIISMMEV